MTLGNRYILFHTIYDIFTCIRHATLRNSLQYDLTTYTGDQILQQAHINLWRHSNFDGTDWYLTLSLNLKMLNTKKTSTAELYNDFFNLLGKGGD